MNSAHLKHDKEIVQIGKDLIALGKPLVETFQPSLQLIELQNSLCELITRIRQTTPWNINTGFPNPLERAIRLLREAKSDIPPGVLRTQIDDFINQHQGK